MISSLVEKKNKNNLLYILLSNNAITDDERYRIVE